ncbi:MAG: leucine-rich repeat domain-containing protein [Lachnospiraceae bacterium]|nr:leucine-rich repeat domain-containing protein [Lachnospiraceae bacterium]
MKRKVLIAVISCMVIMLVTAVWQGTKEKVFAGETVQAVQAGDTFKDENGFITYTITSAGGEKTCAVTDFIDVIYDGEAYSYATRFIIPEQVTWNGEIYTVTAIESKYRSLDTEYVMEFEIPATIQSINTSYFEFDMPREEAEGIRITLKCAPSAFKHLKMFNVNSSAIESIIYVPREYLEEYKELLTGKTGCTFYDNDIEARTYTELPVAAIGDENVLPSGFYYSGSYYRILDPGKKTVSLITKTGSRGMGTTYEQPAYVYYRDEKYTVTRIEYYAYCNVFYDNFFELRLPSTITEIEPKSIGWTVTKLDLSKTQIRTIPSNLVNSGYDEYDEPAVLREVILPETCKKIKKYAFYNCSKLKSISIPAGVRKIGYHALNKTCKKIYIEGSLPKGITRQRMKKTSIYVESDVYQQALETLIKNISLGKCSIAVRSSDPQSEAEDKPEEDNETKPRDEEPEKSDRGEDGQYNTETEETEYNDAYFMETAPAQADLFGLSDEYALIGYGEDAPELWYCWKTSDGMKGLELICDMDGEPEQMSFYDYSQENTEDPANDGNDSYGTGEGNEETIWKVVNDLAEARKAYAEKAMNAAETIFAKAKGKLREADTADISDSPDGIRYHFVRVENETDMPLNYVNISVDPKTGRVIRFDRSWDDNIEFPVPEKLISADEAMKKYENELSLRPTYKRYYETVFDEEEYENVTNEIVRLEYAPANQGVRIDAFTGEAYVRTPETDTDSILHRVYDQELLEVFEKPVKKKNRSRFIRQNGLISEDAAVSVLIGNNRLNTEGITGVDAGLFTGIGDTPYWKISYENGSSCAIIDAKTGRLILFDGRLLQNDYQGIYTKSECKQIAKRFVKEMSAEMYSQMKIVSSAAEYESAGETGGSKKTLSTCKFLFRRQNSRLEYADNDIEVTVDARSGKIVHFRFIMPDKLQKEYSDVSVTPHEAFTGLMELSRMKLEYELQSEPTEGADGKIKKIVKLVYIPVLE